MARRLLLTVLLTVGLTGGQIAWSSASSAGCTALQGSKGRCNPAVTARTAPARAIGTGAATLVGVIWARGARVSYHFEYGARGDYSSRTAMGRISRRAARVVVRARLRGLPAGTLYRYRIVARSRYGLIRASGRSFRTASVVPSVYWGAQIGAQFTGTSAPWDPSAIGAFARSAGKKPSLVAFNVPFAACATPTTCAPWAFPAPQMTAVRDYGAIPVLNWASMSSPISVNEPAYRLAAVSRGVYDSTITSFATAAKAWGHPFLLRFNWEMNGTWFPWGEGANGNAPGQYVAAWRHVHDIFTAVGATNATWVWCPAADFNHDMTDLAELYPGGAYVDWTCIDGYNDGTAYSPSGWLTFDQIFSSTYQQITSTIAPAKPMLLGEVASSERGGSKAAWIQTALTSLPTKYPKIHGVVWYEVSSSTHDWPIETSARAKHAFQQAIANPLYAPNSFARLATGQIEALP